MSNDLFSSLGGLVKGLSGFMPQDDPNTKILTVSTDINELEQQETKIYAGIGRKVFGDISNNPEYASYVYELAAVREKLEKAREVLEAAKREKELLEKQEGEDLEQRTCKNCYAVNPSGTRFCQDCGTRLGPEPKNICQGCGAENKPGSKFCGVCGARMGGI